MGFFSKIGDAVKKATKFVGKNIATVAKVAAPIAAIGAMAIPGVGGLVSGAITKVSGLLGGKGSAPEPSSSIVESIGGLGAAAAPTAVAQSAGGLFGKGGLLGTGIFANKEDQLINAKNRLASVEAKIAEKASELLGVKISDINKAKEVLLGNGKFKEVSEAAVREVNASFGYASTPEEDRSLLSSLASTTTQQNTILYVLGGALVAKILKIW